MNLNFNFNGLTHLKDWWKIVRDNLREIQNSFNKETEDRQAADASLSASVAAEAEARLNNDNVLSGRLDTEESARLAADNNLQSNIDNEVDERQEADAHLQNQISNIVIQNRDEQIMQILGKMILSCDISGDDCQDIEVGVDSEGTPFFALGSELENQLFINSEAVEMNNSFIEVINRYPSGATVDDDWNYTLEYAIYFRWDYITKQIKFGWTQELEFKDYINGNEWYHTICIIEQQYKRLGIGNYTGTYTATNNPNTSIAVNGKLGTPENLIADNKNSILEAVNENTAKIIAAAERIYKLDNDIETIQAALGTISSELDEVNGEAHV